MSHIAHGECILQSFFILNQSLSATLTGKFDRSRLGVSDHNACVQGLFRTTDPEHLWNRLYRAIAVRTEGGVDYGIDNSEPYYDGFDNPEKLIAILDEFLQKHGEDRAPSDLTRALLLN